MDKIITREYATHSAEIFSQCKPMLVGTGGLTLFPDTPLLEEAQRGEFDPLSEKEMLGELMLYLEDLTCDCAFITHHTVAVNLTGSYFLSRKDRIVATLDHAIQHAMRARMGVRYPGVGE
jgi:hypothetical protein